jgi:hypothetical protein
MDPLGYAIAQMAAQSVRRQFQYEPEGDVPAKPPARTVQAARGLKRLRTLAKGPVAADGSMPATKRC